MTTYRFDLLEKQLLADTLTPVNIYLKLRDVFAGTILLESSDYHGQENSLSFICFDPIAQFTVDGNTTVMQFPDGSSQSESVGKVADQLDGFRKRFAVNSSNRLYRGGLFGYIAYDAVRFFEDISIAKDPESIPDILYKLFRFVIVVDHFSNTLTLFKLESDTVSGLSLEQVQQLIYSNRLSTYRFETTGHEHAHCEDKAFLEMVEKGKQHCFRGDVFQIVLSRRFSTAFKGDEFNVYRALRSINPSPYLFYFDFGNFKLFGSSPEAQVQVSDGMARIFPIAGTFRRTGNDLEDQALARQLTADEKENAEHVMLVDLARNDMSRHADNVTVEVFKEIQFYSHLVHLVSKVTGRVREGTSALQIAVDTFPTGTLSGAPKHMAMTLINRYENANRGYYGGAIGFIGFDDSLNHAIMIRTFLSRQNELVYQAGAGIVSKSVAESELQEVNNKLGALRKAIKMAETI